MVVLRVVGRLDVATVDISILHTLFMRIKPLAGSKRTGDGEKCRTEAQQRQKSVFYGYPCVCAGV